jgi:hypothetical protein
MQDLASSREAEALEQDEDDEGIMVRLAQLYGPPRVIGPHGPSIVIANGLLTKALSDDLERCKVKVFSGHDDGRVIWIVPLNQHRGSEPEGSKVDVAFHGKAHDPAASIPSPQADERPSSGRLWTEEEDAQITEARESGLSMREAGKALSGTMGRSPSAIIGRLWRLSKRQPGAKDPIPGTSVPQTHDRPPLDQAKRNLEGNGGESLSPGRGAVPGAPTLLYAKGLQSLLETALLLAGDPRHSKALSIVLKACLAEMASQPEG